MTDPVTQVAIYFVAGVNVSVHLLLGILFKYPPETSPCPSWG
jgi:hypothetical protein